MKALVIGASGFLGGAIASHLVANSVETWGAYHGHQGKIPPGCQPIADSALDQLKDNFDVVVLAAGNYSLSEKELYDVNVELTKTISNLFSTAKLIYISSVSVYGNHEDVMNEKSPYNNPSPYGLAKLAGEAVIQKHPKYAILRLTYLYGKGMSDNSFLPAIIEKAKVDKQITLLGKGERLQDYLNVKDAGVLCQLAIAHDKNGIFLGATGKSLSNTEVAEIICLEVPGCEIKYKDTDVAQWFRFDPSWTQEKLNWQPQEKFVHALKEML